MGYSKSNILKTRKDVNTLTKGWEPHTVGEPRRGSKNRRKMNVNSNKLYFLTNGFRRFRISRNVIFIFIEFVVQFLRNQENSPESYIPLIRL